MLTEYLVTTVLSGGGFLPTDLNDLEVWLDSDDSSTINDTAGAVDQWDDKSGNDNHATATGSARPTTGADVINGRNVIDFNGTSNFLQTAAFSSASSQPNTIFIVCRRTNTNTGANGIYGGIGASNRHNLFTTSTSYGMWSGSSVITGGTFDTNVHLLSTVWDGGDTITRQDGTTIISANPGTNSLTGITLGARFDGNNKGAVEIGEVIVYRRELTTTEIINVEAYLQKKWNTPSTHVFLIAGQSNSVGQDTDDGGADYPAGTLQYGNSTRTLTAASSPLDHLNEQAGTMGFAKQFCIDYKAANPNINILLVPAGRGSTGFANGNWNQGNTEYENAVDSVNEVMALDSTYKFKGILWHQGESDTGATGTYEASLYDMIADMRSDINDADSTTPFILGELTPQFVASNGGAQVINPIIEGVPADITYTGVADNTGLTSKPDNIHYNAASLRTLGSRYYTAYLAALTNT